MSLEFHCTCEKKKDFLFILLVNFVQCQPSTTEVSEQLSQFSDINGRLWRAAEFRRFCCSELQNFASWPAEFVKLFHCKCGPYSWVSVHAVVAVVRVVFNQEMIKL